MMINSTSWTLLGTGAMEHLELMGTPASKPLCYRNDLATHTDTGKYSFFALCAVKQKSLHQKKTL